jgi:hypothetical protein
MRLAGSTLPYDEALLVGGAAAAAGAQRRQHRGNAVRQRPAARRLHRQPGNVLRRVVGVDAEGLRG